MTWWLWLLLGMVIGAAGMLGWWFVTDFGILADLQAALRRSRMPRPIPLSALPPASARAIDRARRANRLPLPTMRRPGIIPLAPLRDFASLDEEPTKP